MRKSFLFFSRGWTPRHELGDVVRWRSRALNSSADLAGRYAVTLQDSFAVRSPDYSEQMSRAKWVQLHSDGGRESDSASAAMTILIWNDTESRTRTLVSVLKETVTPFYT